MEKVQERVVYCDFQSSYTELRERAGVSILYLDRLRISMCEVYKVINEMGPVYPKKLFTQKKPHMNLEQQYQ